MGSLNEFPIASVAEFIRRLNDRGWDRDGRLFQEVLSYLTIEDARQVWAAKKWLEVVETTAGQKAKSGQFSISELLAMLDQKLSEMKAQTGDQKLFGRSQEELLMMMEIERHLDRLAMAKAADARPKRKYGAKKK